MIRMIRAFMAAAAVVLSGGCAVHQWPEQKPEQAATVKIRLRYETDFYVWEHLYDPKQDEYPVEQYPDSGVDDAHPGTSYRYDNEQSSGVVRICLRLYEAGKGAEGMKEYIIDRDAAEGYDCEVELSLGGGSYEVTVWSHLLEYPNDAPFYDAADFRSIYIVDDLYRGSTDHRDAFSGRSAFSLPDKPAEGAEYGCEVEMRRPMGKFEFVTTDLSEFLDRETERRSLSTRASVDDYRVVIAYPYYYPNGYNMEADDIASGSGYRFDTAMTVTGESEASMGFDYVFMKNIRDGAVQAQVSVWDMEGACVANSRVIMIPIRRDWHTVLRGAFLSMDADGGVGVNPDYDGDHNVTFP